MDPQSFGDLTSTEPRAFSKLVADYVRDLSKTIHTTFPNMDIAVSTQRAVCVKYPHTPQSYHITELVKWLESDWTDILTRNISNPTPWICP